MKRLPASVPRGTGRFETLAWARRGFWAAEPLEAHLRANGEAELGPRELGPCPDPRLPPEQTGETESAGLDREWSPVHPNFWEVWSWASFAKGNTNAGNIEGQSRQLSKGLVFSL
jgi:hypothetical protein